MKKGAQHVWVTCSVSSHSAPSPQYCTSWTKLADASWTPTKGSLKSFLYSFREAVSFFSSKWFYIYTHWACKWHLCLDHILLFNLPFKIWLQCNLVWNLEPAWLTIFMIDRHVQKYRHWSPTHVSIVSTSDMTILCKWSELTKYVFLLFFFNCDL